MKSILVDILYYLKILYPRDRDILVLDVVQARLLLVSSAK
jgi:hypothetical protein